MTPGPRRTIVKVCGITRPEDARAAREAGADWLGLVLKGESPRLVSVARAAAIVAEAPERIMVGVMVGAPPEEALRLAREAGMQRLQLHLVDAAGWPADFPLPVAFAVTVDRDGQLSAPPPPLRHLLMLDTADALLPGGTGRSFPWDAAARIATGRPVLLAGGLDGGNVAAAIEQVRPFGVDASSRLESAPGIKDAEKVRRFVAAVRECDARIEARRG